MSSDDEMSDGARHSGAEHDASTDGSGPDRGSGGWWIVAAMVLLVGAFAVWASTSYTAVVFVD